MTLMFLPTLTLADDSAAPGNVAPLVTGVWAVLGWKLSAARLEMLKGVVVGELAPAGETARASSMPTAERAARAAPPRFIRGALRIMGSEQSPRFAAGDSLGSCRRCRY